MQKLLRTFIILLLLVVTGAVVYSQTQLYAPSHTVYAGDAAAVRLAQASHISQEAEASGSKPAVTSTAAAPAPVASLVLGTPNAPVIVKLAEMPESVQEAAEHEQDRQIQRSIARSTARIAATSLAQNFLLLFQATIYFLTLIIIYMMLESVRKFADAASKSAEAAKTSAEMAEAVVARRSEKHKGLRKMPPHFYRKR